MPEYEYDLIRIPKWELSDIAAELNAYGVDGWKLIAVDSGIAYMMRELSTD